MGLLIEWLLSPRHRCWKCRRRRGKRERERQPGGFEVDPETQVPKKNLKGLSGLYIQVSMYTSGAVCV